MLRWGGGNLGSRNRSNSRRANGRMTAPMAWGMLIDVDLLLTERYMYMQPRCQQRSCLFLALRVRTAADIPPRATGPHRIPRGAIDFLRPTSESSAERQSNSLNGQRQAQVRRRIDRAPPPSALDNAVRGGPRPPAAGCGRGSRNLCKPMNSGLSGAWHARCFTSLFQILSESVGFAGSQSPSFVEAK
jgi:hypothetical protein